MKNWKLVLLTLLVLSLIGCGAGESTAPDEEVNPKVATSEPTEEMMGTGEGTMTCCEDGQHQDGSGMMGDAPVDAMFIDGMIPR